MQVSRKKDSLYKDYTSQNVNTRFINYTKKVLKCLYFLLSLLKPTNINADFFFNQDVPELLSIRT